MHQSCVLHHIPPVGGEHILAALVEDGVEVFPVTLKVTDQAQG